MMTLVCFVVLQNQLLTYFFKCCVAQAVWVEISEIIGRVVGTDFELVVRLWVCDKKFKLINVVTTAAFWTVWKVRKELCFQGGQ
jgi:hypothetical protein